MFKVLLVDDEPWSLVTLRNAFNWEAFGFEVVKETNNSLNACDFLCNEVVHAAFIDIRMPGMSGLELIKTIRSRKINVEFVIVSGFSEFSYAQQALKEGAFDYCLKPIEEETTDDLLKRLSEHLETTQISDDVSFYENLLENGKDISDLLSSRRFKNIFSQYCVVIGNMALESHTGSSFSTEYSNLVLNLGLGRYCNIINADNLSIEAIRNNIDSGYSPEYGCIGLSSIADSPQSLPKLLKEADMASKSYFISKDCRIRQYTDTDYRIPNKILEEIMDTIDNHKAKDLKNVIEKIPDTFVSNNLGIEDVAYLWNQVTAFALRKYPGIDILSELEFLYYDAILNKFGDLNTLCSYLSAIFTSLEERTSSSLTNSYMNDNIRLMLDFINQNYHRELYLKDLSESFHFSLTYCCEIFKKVTGTTFTQYIAGLRMKKASELLLSSSLSIEEICDEIGYNDYFYFNNVFKKHFGISPFRYRKNKGCKDVNL